MRLDHLLSKDSSKGCVLLFSYQGANARTEYRMSVSLLTGTYGYEGSYMSLGSTECERSEHEGAFADNFTFPVAMRPGVTPVPIPNTMVKPGTADGTALETVWESRRLPESTFTQKCVNHEP